MVANLGNYQSAYYTPGFNQALSYSNNYGQFSPALQPYTFQPYLSAQNNASQSIQDQYKMSPKPHDYFMRGALSTMAGIGTVITSLSLLGVNAINAGIKEIQRQNPHFQNFKPLSHISAVFNGVIVTGILMGLTWGIVKAVRLFTPKSLTQPNPNYLVNYSIKNSTPM